MSEETTTMEDGVSQSKLDNILRKVQSLLNLAEHANTGEEEAQAFRVRAQELMQRYRIEESELIAADPTAGMKPVMKTWGICESGSPFYNEFYWLFSTCCQHAGVRMTYSWGPDPDNEGKRSLLGKLVGYESDVRFATMLYATLRMQFSSRLEPAVDPSLSDEDNVYNLRSAGIERGRIGTLMGWGGEGTNGPGRVTRVYKAACAARGEDPVLTGRGNSVALYRQSFAKAFCARIDDRLYRARTTAGVENAGELVLAGRKENVDEAFYEFFPDLRPKPAGSDVATSGTAARKVRYRKYTPPKDSVLGLRAGRAAADAADLTARASAKKARGINE